MRVLFLGEPDDGISLSSHHARLLGESGIDVAFATNDKSWRSQCRSVGVIHLVTSEQRDNTLLRRLVAARGSGVAILRYWTGVDLLWARHHAPTRRFAHALGQLGTMQLVTSEDLIEGLRAVGVTAKRGPIASPNISSTVQPQAFPEKFTVLCHLPTSRRAFCGGEIVDSLIKSVPEARFLILGDADTDYRDRTNVESLGMADDVTRTIQRATLTIHPIAFGGVSRLVLESLGHGRGAISTVLSPHVLHAISAQDFKKTIKSQYLDARFDLEGREYACREYDKRACLRELISLLDHCLDEAMSGSRLRCHYLAAGVRMRHPGLLSRKPFPWIDPAELPPEAEPLRLLIADQHQRPVPLSG